MRTLAEANGPGIGFAHQCSMLIATMDLWKDAAEIRSCRVLAYDAGSELEMHAHGQRLLLQSFESVEEAVAGGELWRAALGEIEPQAA